MKVLSIDVGIKNLAFCLFERMEYFTITKWGTVNISVEEVLLCKFVDPGSGSGSCSSSTKINQVCNKPAKFKKDGEHYCLKHSKKHSLHIPTAEQKPSFINKQKIQKLYDIADTHKITYNPKIKKQDLCNLINDHIKTYYFENVENTRAGDVDLFNIGRNIRSNLDKLFINENKIDYVIIENQISPIATRMKTIQGMLVQYFVMSTLNVDHINFISASNKLKICDIKEKTKYSDRKKMGIDKCLEIITTDCRFSEHVDYFVKHKKKDDLADSFLQGLWFINNHHF